eukprot:2673-Heterococcus_DN1.PRE.1
MYYCNTSRAVACKDAAHGVASTSKADNANTQDAPIQPNGRTLQQRKLQKLPQALLLLSVVVHDVYTQRHKSVVQQQHAPQRGVRHPAQGTMLYSRSASKREHYALTLEAR